MTNIYKALENLCPMNVEFKKFGDIAQITRGASPRPIKSFLTSDENGVNWVKIGDVATGSKYITKTSEKITQEGANKSRLVHKGDFILSNSMSFGRPYIMKIDGCIHDGWLAISEFDDYLIPDFLYYVLVSSDIQNEMKRRASSGGAVQNLNADIVRELILPVPPLDVQRKIVDILDRFTLQTAELSKKLSSELDARKKQYKHYRCKIIEGCDESTKKVTIADLGKWQGGKTPSMKERKYWENGTIPWISSKDMKAPVLYDTEDHITDSALKEASMTLLPEGSIVMVTRSGILKHTLPVAYIPFKTTINQDIKALVVKEGVSSRYVSLVMQAFGDDIRIKTKKQGGTVDSLDFKKIMEYEIPLPEYDKQVKIVEELEQLESVYYEMFDCLIHEIDDRQKQYEYYRDKLLTFKEAV